MHAAVSNPVDRSASHDAWKSPMLIDCLIDQLADDLVTLNAEGEATMARLCELGWFPDFIANNRDKATARANQRFVRKVDDDPVRTPRIVQDEMSDIIASLMPPVQLIVAELQGRGYTKRQIDLHLAKCKARAAYGFATSMQTGAH